MVSAHSMLLLVALPTVALATFAPFPMHQFAEDKAKTGTRRFSHEEHHLLEGGTALHLRWSADADPDSIMALDTEQDAGVKLASCTPNQLVLHLPASHVEKAKAWVHVTASEHIHGCPHLEDHPLYHRIESLEFTKHPETPKGGATAVLTTKELYSISQVLPNVDFAYDVKPVDSLHPDLQNEAKRYYAEQKALKAKDEAELSARRLSAGSVGLGNGATWTVASATVPTMSPNGTWQQNLGTDGKQILNTLASGFHKSIGSVEIQNNVDTVDSDSKFGSWQPMTHANFGWNWNYHTNTTRNPQFKFALPGMRGYVLLKNPYLKFLGQFTIKFQSKWNEVNPFATPPRVKMDTNFEGNAYINADLSLMSNIYRDVSEDPFGRFHIPLLNNFTKETHYFKKVHFFIANIPVSLQPGVSINLNAYHLGLFKGAVRLGVNVHVNVKANAQYDSLADLKMDFKASALNVKILPPTWMIYTKHLEFGALLTPAFWIKGGIGPVRDVTLELQLRPYANVSVTQEDQAAYGVQQQVMEKELVIIPFRAINLQIGTEWSVGIEANGRKKMTSTEMSLGVVEFSDYVEHFRFGLIDQRRLMRDPIRVCLFRNGVWQQGKIVPVYCESVVDGECQPSPFNVEFLIGTQTVIVQLTTAWHARPVPYMLSKVRAMSFVFPQLSLSPEASAAYTQAPPASVAVKLTRNGREYRAVATARVVHAGLVMFNTNLTQDLGVAWLDAWRLKYGSIDGSSPSYGGKPSVTNLIDPSVELFFIGADGSEKLVAQTFLPAVHWDQILPGMHSSAYSQASDGWYHGASGVGQTGASALAGIFGQPQQAADVASDERAHQFPQNPEEVFKMQRRLQGSVRDYDAGRVFMGNVPLVIAMQGTGGSNTPFATGRLGIDVHGPASANRWLRPFHTERFVQGSTHFLYWTTRGAMPTRPQSFQFIAFKVDPTTGVFTPTSMRESLDDQVCSVSDTGARSYMGYGSECAFQQKLQVDPGLIGITVVFELRWFDQTDFTNHKMMSAPVSFISKTEPARTAPDWQSHVVSFPKPPARKLKEEGGNMVDAPESSDKEIEIALDGELPVIKESEEGHQKTEKNRRLGQKNLFSTWNGRQLYGYSPSNIDFKQRMSALHPICTRKPLHYEIGAGIFFRAKIHNFHLPSDTASAPGPLGALASLASMANMDTNDIPLAQTRLGKKLSSFFPKGLCTEGVCDGTLPGCPGQEVKSMLIPKVEFSMKRNFVWNETTQQKAKEAVAYGMALVPELIRVTSIVIGALMHSSTTARPGSNGYVNLGDVIYVHGRPCRWTRNDECANHFNYRGQDYEGCSIEDHHHNGWCSVDRYFVGNWRNCFLTCRDEAGKAYTIKDLAKYTKGHGDDTPLARKLSEEEPKTNRILVEFEPKGMNYMVDKDLIQHLIRRKAFRGIVEDGREKELGENEIVSFHVHTGDTEAGQAEMIPVGPEEKFEVDFTGKAADLLPQQPVSVPLMSLLAGMAVLAVASLAAAIYKVSPKRSAPYVVVDEEMESHPEE